MGKSNSKVSMYLSFVVLVSLLLIINMAESRLSQFGHGKAKAFTPTCVSIYAQQEGDTCFSISQAFNLTATQSQSQLPQNLCWRMALRQWFSHLI
ncbi:hypothetical protein V6N12_011760 [Hibiscus sabdariffa]|uniref:LysM domain-containing protein n=1 Tax=Hibiscus sabdariffa TaxID=183260 RepID=A0ABR2BTE6_9ROSI